MTPLHRNVFRGLRRRVVFVPPPGRERLGLSEREVEAGLRPRTGLVVFLGAVGFSPSYRESEGRGS